MLQGYWQTQLSPAMKSAVLADWADELEDWTREQVRWGLRRWRRNNPNKKPNPGHIAALLKQKWAAKVNDQLDAAERNIKSGKRYLCTSIPSTTARALVAAGRVTEEECREVGV